MLEVQHEASMACSAAALTHTQVPEVLPILESYTFKANVSQVKEAQIILKIAGTSQTPLERFWGPLGTQKSLREPLP